jgi:tetratricopeptide (TPR) repeat protein
MVARGYLYVAVLAAGGLLLAGCGTVGPKTKSSGPAIGDSKAPPAAAVSSNAVAPEELAGAHAHYAAGVIHELNGEVASALEEFSKAALADPDDDSLVLDVSRRFLIRKQPERALALLTNATARPGASGALFARLGFIYSQLGKTDLAIKANRVAIKKLPQFLEGYQNLFLAYLQTKRLDEAFKALDQASKQPDTDAEFLIGLAELYANLAREAPDQKAAANAGALAALNRAAKLKPNDVVLRLRLADGFNALGATTNAAPIYLEVLKQQGESDDLPVPRNVLRAKLADIYMWGQDRAGAVEQLEGIVRDDPTNPLAYFYLGSIAFDQKQMTNAVECFSRALLLNPDFEQAYYDLASAQISLNQTVAAFATLQRARARFPENFIIPYLKGLTHTRRKEYAEAIASFTAAEVFARVAEPQRLTEIYFQLGSAYERSGNLPEAEKYFEKAIELKPDFAGALNYLGYMWAERGVNLERARTLIEKALKAEPKNAAFLDSLGWVLFKLHQPAAALEQLQKAVDYVEEPDATIYDHLGDVYAALNQTGKAREAWSKSLKLEPSEQVQKKLDGLAVK